jgi:hypothetical protein
MMDDYEKTQAGMRLMAELLKGRKAGEQQEWETIESLENLEKNSSIFYQI